MSYKSAIEKVKSRRKSDMLLYEARYLSALHQYPQLKQLDMAIFDIKKLDNNHPELAKLNQQRDKIIKELNLFAPPYNCEICLDTGLKDNKPCSCVINSMFDSHEYKHTFDDFDFNVFRAEDKKNVERSFNLATAFCQKFPATNSLNVVILGATGTGKTFLSSCIGERLTKLGFSVVFCSSFGFVNKMLAYHTSRENEKLEHILPILDCDLLIIDDLGSESMLKNVTAEYFYLVLNERMRLNRHTIVTTNLDNEKVGLRYGERFMSRLFDARCSLGLTLASNDLRQKSKLN